MSFVVDGSEWQFDGQAIDDVDAAIDAFLERVDTAQSRDETVWIGDDLQSRPMLDGQDLWTMAQQLSAEVQQSLAAWLMSAPRYGDEVDWPAGAEDFRIQIDGGEPGDNCDVAWAHHSVRAGRAVACLSLNRDRPMRTESAAGFATVHWVKDERSHREFWRSVIEIERDSEATLARLAPHAYPDLFFCEGVWDGLGRFEGGYTRLSDRVRRYLAKLNDHGHWAFTFPPPALRVGEPAGPEHHMRPSNQTIERRFHGLNLEIAPENPDVYRDGTCRAAREVEVQNRTLYCEWHGKFELHQNRLYVHPPVPESEDKVVIAIFHKHLPLPR
ncbi:hypothetical protein P3T18_003113 [Paraburkholderia sp. GAS199]|uniref:hypothetical protein n=1 Tax=Paraburkholderia sp. GAS199 TaxID=3035126 RepID=UPI003D1E0772